MSTPCFSSTPEDPNEALFGHEFDAQIDLMTKLHQYHEGAILIDDATRAHTAEHEEPQGPTEPKYFIWTSASARVLPKYRYDEMEWTPKEGSPASVWVEGSILVRYPRLEGEEFEPYSDARGSLTPQDILIEVNGFLYLFNDLGVEPYPDGEALVPSMNELHNPLRNSEVKPNVFSIAPGADLIGAPYLSASQLKDVLLEDSSYTQREDR